MLCSVIIINIRLNLTKAVRITPNTHLAAIEVKRVPPLNVQTVRYHNTARLLMVHVIN